MSAQQSAIAELGRVFQGQTVSGLTEWQLLERYLDRRDGLAFEALVTRHGPMVLGVCRRMLGSSPEAEDAFQATFLVLVRRARDLGPRDAIGPWLYGVATRVAARARAQVTRHRRLQAIPLDFPVIDRSGALVDPDLVEILDQELGRLPAKYRSPLVLCYLEGRTHEEAARDLRWPLGTVKGRLARARELLRSRLARRGLAPPAGVVGVLSSPDLRVTLERPLVGRTVGVSGRLAAGQSVAQVASASISSLVEGVVATMIASKLKWAAVAAVATGFAFTSAAVLGRQEAKKLVEEAKGLPTKPAAIEPIPSEVPPPAVYEKPGAIIQPKDASDNMRRLGPVPKGKAAEAADRDDARSNDPRSRQILAKLEEPVSMSFANDTPLDDVLKYIKQATTTATFSGIPIYVDPIGLQEAERSMNSTVTIDLEGVPLRRTLQLILTQLKLAYFVQDGMLVITSEDRASEPLPPVMPKPAPIHQMYEKAERGELSSKELKELIEVIRMRRLIKQMRATYNTNIGPSGLSGGNPEFPGEEAAKESKELLKDVRELIQLLKAEKEGKKPAETKKAAQ
jgi:RNA polymerase sigma factor (sigma-70 family)